MLAAMVGLLLAAAPAEPFTLQAVERADAPMIEIAAKQDLAEVVVHLQRTRAGMPGDHQVTFPRLLRGEVQRLALEEARFVRVVARVGDQAVERTLQARPEPPPPPKRPKRRIMGESDTPRVSAGSGLDIAAAAQALRLGPLIACVEGEDGRPGRLVLHVEVSPEGRVTKARVRSAMHRAEAIERCLVERAQEWQFPRRSRASKVLYSLNFKEV